MIRMRRDNPFTLTFGKQPNQFITRYEDMDNIMEAFASETPLSQAYLIEGIRGSGKTVLMTAVANQLKKEEEWIVVNINPVMNLLEEFAFRLKDAVEKVPRLIDQGFSISVAGFGGGINGKEETKDAVGLINRIFKQIMKKKKRVLITIDEVLPDENMRIFASQFQIFVRQEYPVFLIMTGLYENIYEIQNDPALTFLLRTPKIRLEPLSLLQITRQYRDIFKIDEETARKRALLTKGYAFAFQVVGAVYWKYGADKAEDFLLEEIDEMLDDFVYKKVWASLTNKEREIILLISKDEVKAKEICDALSMAPGTFSKYRDSLLKKGVIFATKHGYISLALPRFYHVVKNY